MTVFNASRLVTGAAVAAIAATALFTSVSPSQAQRVIVVPNDGFMYSMPGPAWAHPGRCFTDDGYGRFVPCGYSGGTN